MVRKGDFALILEVSCIGILFSRVFSGWLTCLGNLNTNWTYTFLIFVFFLFKCCINSCAVSIVDLCGSAFVRFVWLISKFLSTIEPYTLPCQMACPEGAPNNIHRLSCPSITMDPQVRPLPLSSNQSVVSSLEKSPGSIFKPGHSRSNSTGSIRNLKQVE